MRGCFLIAALVQVISLDPITVARGDRSGISAAREAIARSSDEWKELWALHAPGQAAPSVDFSKEMVAAVFFGTRPTGGFSVEILRARRDGDVLTIEYAERRPDPGLLVTQALTSPFHVVKLPRHDGPVRFTKVE